MSILNYDPFYWGLLRKYTAIFGTIFNEMQVPRYDTQGNLKELLVVPLLYADKEKTLARLFADPNIDRQAEVVLPRMSFLQGSPKWAGARKLHSINRVTVKTSANTYTSQWNPVPYDIPYTLWIYAEFVEDANKIVEQILPFFTPEMTLSTNLIPVMGKIYNVPIILDDVNYTESDGTGSFKDRRMCVYELSFTIKADFWGPVFTSPLIRFANVSIYIPETNTAAEGVGVSIARDRVTVQPGLTANGQPTSDVSLSIPYLEIDADQNWGYIVDIYGNLDPLEGVGASNADSFIAGG